MLKCESKLIKFILELNGLMNTDRHDWNMLWTHTQGKTYFYERLTNTQKINHFPLSYELTRKDRLAVNIKKMQKKYSKTYFNFIPETFVLPEEFDKFEDAYNQIQEKLSRNNGAHKSIQKVAKNNMWIVKP
jgi:tubulin polyglutamylase TTLL5